MCVYIVFSLTPHFHIITPYCTIYFYIILLRFHSITPGKDRAVQALLKLGANPAVPSLEMRLDTDD